MDPLRAIARPMLGSMFVYGGLDSFRNPEAKAPKAGPVLDTIGETLGLPEGDTASWVRLNGAVQVVAGTMLAIGKLPRVSAIALAASLAPTTFAGHRFWEESDSLARKAQTIHFLKNVSMFGGLLLAADDTGGRPSIPWRIHEAVDHAQERVHEHSQ
jgi:putative oxidoreductase